jgi:hypothetical protein
MHLTVTRPWGKERSLYSTPSRRDKRKLEIPSKFIPVA